MRASREAITILRQERRTQIAITGRDDAKRIYAEQEGHTKAKRLARDTDAPRDKGCRHPLNRDWFCGACGRYHPKTWLVCGG